MAYATGGALRRRLVAYATGSALRRRLVAYATGGALRRGLGAFVVLVTVVLAACSGGSTATPVPDDGGPLFDGRPVGDYYRSNCSSCHGTDRGGGIGPALVPERLTEDDAFYFETIAQGRAGTSMPAWRRSGLNDREIQALVDFIRTEP